MLLQNRPSAASSICWLRKTPSAGEAAACQSCKKENRRVRRLKKNLHRLSEGDIHELLLISRTRMWVPEQLVFLSGTALPGKMSGKRVSLPPRENP